MVTPQQAGHEYFEATRQLKGFTEFAMPEQPNLNAFNQALLQLVWVADERARSEPGRYGQSETSWVPAAQKILQQCARVSPAMRGLERTKLFSPENREDQRLLFHEMQQYYF